MKKSKINVKPHIPEKIISISYFLFKIKTQDAKKNLNDMKQNFA